MKKSPHLYITFLLILCLSASTLYSAVPTRTQVMNLLEGFEWTLNAERFAQLGENVDQVLIEIISDPKPIINYYRFRALEALRLYPSEKVAQFIENYTQKKEVHSSHLRRAVDSFSRAFSNTQPERVQKLSARFLDHHDLHLQLIAAKALNRLERPEAKGLVQKYLQKTNQRWIHDQLKPSLKDPQNQRKESNRLQLHLR